MRSSMASNILKIMRTNSHPNAIIMLSLLIALKLVLHPVECGFLKSSQVLERTNIHTRQLRAVSSDFAPKLIHQPQSVQVKPSEPHTIECPIEAEPEAEVKWFKDDQLLGSEPTHLEQTRNELMFFQMNEEDSGEYHCQATNYLGSISSERFQLTVQSSVHDARIRFEPKVAEASAEQQVEFTCTLPVADPTFAQLPAKVPSSSSSSSFSSNTQRNKIGAQPAPEVSWKRNGRKLSVKWLSEPEELAELTTTTTTSTTTTLTRASRFLARQVGPSEFVLTLARLQQKDNNSTFTCLYKLTSADSADDLANESSPVSVRVYPAQAQPASSSTTNEKQQPIQLDVNLGAPIENLDLQRNPNLHQQQNHTTQLVEPTLSGKPIGLDRSALNGIRQTLESLFELAKPTLIIFGLLFLFSLIVILQLLLVRRRANNNQNRYMKHQQFLSSTGSASSSATSGSCGNHSATLTDPILSSLLSRTLSTASAVSLNGIGGSSGTGPIGLKQNKYRSYRDQMHKVAAVANNDMVSLTAGDDIVDGYLAVAQHLQHQAAAAAAAVAAVAANRQNDHEPFFAQPPHSTGPLPPPPPPTSSVNLYNQSLAAREQARTLLRASEHMRSLRNLSQLTAAATAAGPLKQANGGGGTTARKQNMKQDLMRLTQQQQQQQQQYNGSHLNLPFSNIAFGQTTNNSQMHSSYQSASRLVDPSSIWPNSNLAQLNSARQNHQQRLPLAGTTSAASGVTRHLELFGSDEQNNSAEHYQLVNCSSISPSSTCSIGGSNVSSNNGNQQHHHNLQQHHSRQTSKTSDFHQLDVASLNHYSTIENNDTGEDDYASGYIGKVNDQGQEEEEDCYEEVG